MKRWWIGCVLVVLLSLSALAQSQGTQYQQGKVLAVEKVEDSGQVHVGGEVPVPSSAHTYNVSIQVGDTVYVCRYQEHTGELASWLQGKEVQVRVKGKVMYVKRATGKDDKASILRTTKADKS